MLPLAARPLSHVQLLQPTEVRVWNLMRRVGVMGAGTAQLMHAQVQQQQLQLEKPQFGRNVRGNSRCRISILNPADSPGFALA